MVGRTCALNILTKPPFERAGKTAGQHTAIYALRLGNLHYPHMKLQIQPWENESRLHALGQCS